MKKRKVGIFLVALIIVMPLFILPNAYATTISKEQIDAFRTAKTVRIVVNQSYGEAGGVSLPFWDTAKKFLEYAGLRVVSATENYDLMLKIEAEGQALGANYQYAGWLFTGASLSGSISLEAQGVPAYRKSFSGRVSPPTVTGFRRENPADAPFRVVSISGGVTRSTFHEHGSFVSKITEIVGEIYSADSLISALKDENSDVRGGAAEALGDIKDPQAVQPLIAALKDERPRVRTNAVEALVKMGKPVVEPLIAALKEESPRVRTNAVEALVKMGKPVVEPLIAALKHESSLVRWEAAGALKKIKDPRAIEPLIAALKDENSDVRGGAAEALGDIKDPQAVEPLIAALKDEKSSVQRKAAESLGKIAGKNFGRDPDKWQEWWEQNKESFHKAR